MKISSCQLLLQRLSSLFSLISMKTVQYKFVFLGLIALFTLANCKLEGENNNTPPPTQEEQKKKALDLIKSGAADDIAALKALIAGGLDVNEKIEGYTLLHRAAFLKNSDAIKLLIENNADINAQADGSQIAAIHYISMNDDVESLKLLIERKANLMIVDSSGNTPFFYASMAQKVDPNDKDKLVETELIKELKKYLGAADLQAKSLKGAKPEGLSELIINLSKTDNAPEANRLLVYLLSGLEDTQLYQETLKQFPKILNEMITFNKPPKLPLITFAAYGNSQFFTDLVSDVNQLVTNGDNSTPVSFVLIESNFSNIDKLLAKGLDLNAVKSKGDVKTSLLQEMINKAFWHIAEFLENKGAKLTDDEIKKLNGGTAKQLIEDAINKNNFSNLFKKAIEQNDKASLEWILAKNKDWIKTVQSDVGFSGDTKEQKQKKAATILSKGATNLAQLDTIASSCNLTLQDIAAIAIENGNVALLEIVLQHSSVSNNATSYLGDVIKNAYINIKQLADLLIKNNADARLENTRKALNFERRDHVLALLEWFDKFELDSDNSLELLQKLAAIFSVDEFFAYPEAKELALKLKEKIDAFDPNAYNNVGLKKLGLIP